MRSATQKGRSLWLTHLKFLPVRTTTTRSTPLLQRARRRERERPESNACPSTLLVGENISEETATTFTYGCGKTESTKGNPRVLYPTAPLNNDSVIEARNQHARSALPPPLTRSWGFACRRPGATRARPSLVSFESSPRPVDDPGRARGCRPWL